MARLSKRDLRYIAEQEAMSEASHALMPPEPEPTEEELRDRRRLWNDAPGVYDDELEDEDDAEDA